jgi:hypothetical protein
VKPADCASQKILDNSKHCDGSKPPLLQRVSALWNTFVVQVLGLTPIPDANKKNGQDQSDAEDEGAFELLRVFMHFPAPSRALFV